MQTQNTNMTGTGGSRSRGAPAEPKQPTWKTYPVDSLRALEDLVMDMPKAEGRAVYVSKNALPTGTAKEIASYLRHTTDAPDVVIDPTHKAIVNTSTNQNALLASAGYQILGHREFFSSVQDVVEKAGCRDAHGFLIASNGGNRMKLRLIFEDSVIEEPGHGRNIKVGGEFSNSYDSAFAARGNAFYLRLSCTNQMVIRNIIPESLFSRAHSAASQMILLEAVTKELENFMENLSSAGMTFKRKMIESINDPIFIEDPVQVDLLMKDIFKVDVHAEGIAYKAKRAAVRSTDDPKLHTTTRWDLYNSATDYASHESIVTPNVQDSILYRAETRLLRDSVELPPVPIKTR